MKRLALLIVGEIRTLALHEQVLFFAKLLNYLQSCFDKVDTYLILKMPNKACYAFSKRGQENLSHFFAIIRPRRFTLNTTLLNDQSVMIDTAFMQALENEDTDFQYDFFMRIRPDSFVQTKELKFDQYTENYIYTSYKFDQIANDQVFFANRQTMFAIWIPNRTRYFTITKKNIFQLFVDKRVFKQSFRSWIVRDYDHLDHWNRSFPFIWPYFSQPDYPWSETSERLVIENDNGDLFDFLKKRCECIMESKKNFNL
jgi:hypothetical protein